MRVQTSLMVRKIEERFRTVHLRGVGDHTVTAEVSTGWWLVLDNYLALNVGADRPPFEPGQEIALTLTRR